MGKEILVNIFETTYLLFSVVISRTNFDLVLPSHTTHDPHISKIWEKGIFGLAEI